jgi:transmembrane sensor
MNKISDLIRKLWTGELSPEEAVELRELLRPEDGEIRKELNNSFNEVLTQEPNAEENNEATEMFSRLLVKIAMKTDKRTKVVFNIRTSMRWAAVWMAVILTGALIYHSSPKQALVKATIIGKREPSLLKSLKSVTNLTKDKMTIALSDSSVVTLFPNSTISYREEFENNARNIRLEGMAYFKVAKDVHKPFIVESAGFTTTALGTEFLVDARKSCKVEVRLYKGKVVIRHVDKDFDLKNDVYLIPLQSFSANVSTGEYNVNKFSPAKYSPGAGKNKMEGRKPAKAELDFDHEPLNNVFDKLNENFHVNIKYSERQLKGLCFTGTLLQTDSLQTIIAIISKMNGLAFEERGGCILVYQKK